MNPSGLPKYAVHEESRDAEEKVVVKRRWSKAPITNKFLDPDRGREKITVTRLWKSRSRDRAEASESLASKEPEYSVYGEKRGLPFCKTVLPSYSPSLTSNTSCDEATVYRPKANQNNGHRGFPS
ncbi:hypothetical protein SprV_0200815300 [Sparganum proliferum]